MKEEEKSNFILKTEEIKSQLSEMVTEGSERSLIVIALDKEEVEIFLVGKRYDIARSLVEFESNEETKDLYLYSLKLLKERLISTLLSNS